MKMEWVHKDAKVNQVYLTKLFNNIIKYLSNPYLSSPALLFNKITIIILKLFLTVIEVIEAVLEFLIIIRLIITIKRIIFNHKICKEITVAINKCKTK